MIEPDVKWIDFTDSPPTDDNKPFMLAMTAGIGPRGDDSADNFQVIVCNPAWLTERLSRDSAVWPRGYLVVAHYDAEYVQAALQSLAETFRRSSDWRVFAERLNRYLLWEFEDLDDFQGEVRVPRRASH